MDAATTVPYGRKTQHPPKLAEVHILWITAGLGCDGNSVSITGASEPSIEDVMLGAIPGLPKVHLHNAVLAYTNGSEFLEPFHKAVRGELYRVPEILTLGRFPDARESDSTWRTQEVRHVGSDTIAPRFWCVPAAWFGEEDERRPAGQAAAGARRNL